MKILAPNHKKRLSIFSFYFEDYHFNLVVKLLNDRFGIQTRGGCSCAGTYGHFLLNVDQQKSKEIATQILEGCSIEKPGWIRLSIHPTMTNKEIRFMVKSIKELAANFKDWEKDYNLEQKHTQVMLNRNFNDSFIENKITSVFNKSFN